MCLDLSLKLPVFGVVDFQQVAVADSQDGSREIKVNSPEVGHVILEQLGNAVRVPQVPDSDLAL